MYITIGLGVIAGLFLAMAFLLDEKHVIIKLVSFVFSILIMYLIANHLLGNLDYCSIELRNITKSVGGNFTQYEYDRVCFTNTETTGITTFKLLTYFLRILLYYIFVFIVYWIFDFFGINLFEKIQELFNK